jgi:hypothetical protein
MSQMKAKASSLLRPPVKIDVTMLTPKTAAPDRINVWTCPKCGGYTVCIDIHEGVTPFMLRCRASGREGDCDGMATSAFYPKGPRPPHIPPPAWEWFRPVGSEYRKLSAAMREHVDKGGLDIRKIAS